MKKAVILYDSVYGNTKKVAMSLSRGLEAGGLHVDSNSIKDFNIGEMVNYDIIGIGGPTHYHGASKKMKSFLNKIKHHKMEGKYGFVFETRSYKKIRFWVEFRTKKNNSETWFRHSFLIKNEWRKIHIPFDKFHMVFGEENIPDLSKINSIFF